MASVPDARETVGSFGEFLRRQFRIIVCATCICLALAVAYLFMTTRLYRATTRLTIESSAARQSDTGSQIPQSENFLRTQGEKITSRSILALALANPDLKDLKTFQDAASRLKVMRKGLTIDVSTSSDVLAVSFDSPYSEEAPQIVNAVVEAFKQYQTEPAHSNAADVLAVYQEQIDKLRLQLSDTTGQMQAMEQQYGVLSSSADSKENINLRRLAALSQELTNAQFETLKAKSDLDEATKLLPKEVAGQGLGKSTSIRPLVVSPDQEAALRSELIDLESRQQEMRQLYLPNHPALLALSRQIDHVNREYAGAVEQRWLLALQHQQQMQSAFDAQQKLVIQIDAKSADYERLHDEAERLRKSIDNLEARMQAITDTREADRVAIEVIDPADVAVLSHPLTIPTLSEALMLGLMLGLTIGAARDWMDDHLRSVSEVRTVTGLSVLGTVPHIPWVMSLGVAAQKTVLEPTSDVAQAYRAIRAAVDAGAPRERCRTILITSAEPGDGKTTSAANLAIAMAQTGKRVLLVDAVLRQPALHTIFKVPHDAGFSTLLGGQISEADKMIQKTSVANLSVLPAGPATTGSTELLNTPTLPELLDHLADMFDRVIIDAPPVVALADARIIAASCDLTLLVLRADTATRGQSTAARDGLLGVGAHVLGLILNRVPRENLEPSQPPPSHNGAIQPSRPIAAATNEEHDIIDLAAGP